MSEFCEPWHSLPLDEWPKLEARIRRTERQIRKARAMGNQALAATLETQLPPTYCRRRPSEMFRLVSRKPPLFAAENSTTF